MTDRIDRIRARLDARLPDTDVAPPGTDPTAGLEPIASDDTPRTWSEVWAGPGRAVYVDRRGYATTRFREQGRAWAVAVQRKARLERLRERMIAVNA